MVEGYVRATGGVDLTKEVSHTSNVNCLKWQLQAVRIEASGFRGG